MTPWNKVNCCRAEGRQRDKTRKQHGWNYTGHGLILKWGRKCMGTDFTPMHVLYSVYTKYYILQRWFFFKHGSDFPKATLLVNREVSSTCLEETSTVLGIYWEQLLMRHEFREYLIILFNLNNYLITKFASTSKHASQKSIDVFRSISFGSDYTAFMCIFDRSHVLSLHLHRNILIALPCISKQGYTFYWYFPPMSRV